MVELSIYISLDSLQAVFVEILDKGEDSSDDVLILCLWYYRLIGSGT